MCKIVCKMQCFKTLSGGGEITPLFPEQGTATD